jgi:DNA-binding NarL/FixJ family response regulator
MTKARRKLSLQHQDNVLKMMAQGWSRKQISKALLFETRDGVDYYWQLIVKRFNTTSPFRIALLALKAGII